MMPTLPRCDSSSRSTSTPNRSDDSVVEIHLLLPLWQLDALEMAARSHGMTTGQLLRRVISDLVTEPIGGTE